MRRLLAAGLIASLFVVVGPAGKAEACSCALADPAAMLDQSDAAFVGTLLERPTEPNSPDGFSGIWIFEVEEWVKGEMGTQVGVHSALDGAACGFEMSVGDRAGIFLYNDNGRPSGGLCSVTTPEGMLGANQPLVFDGEGPPVFLVASDTGRARIATLDASGRLIAAAGDEGFGWSISVCPGGNLVVDVVEGEITIRDTATLEPVRTVDAAPDGRAEQVWCLDAAGDEILAQIWDEAGTTSTLTVLGESEPVFVGESYLMDATADKIALVVGPTNASVDLIDIHDGDRTRLVSGIELGALRFSPDGQLLLVTAQEFDTAGGYTTTATVYATSTGEAVWASEPLANTEVAGWLDDARLIGNVYPIDAVEPAWIIIDVPEGTTTDADLTGWEFALVGDSVVSVAEGNLYLMPPGGKTSVLAALPSPSHRLVAVLDEGATISLPDGETTPTTSSTLAPATTPSTVGPEAAPPSDDSGVALALVVAAGGLAAVLVGWTMIRRRV